MTDYMIIYESLGIKGLGLVKNFLIFFIIRNHRKYRYTYEEIKCTLANNKKGRF